MNKKFDLIGIGECLIELYEQAPHAYKQSVAGDVFNTLFYASKLRLRTGFVSSFGSDELTKNILDVMDREGIDRSCTSISQKKTNGLYLISNQESGQPNYSFWRNDSAAKETLRTIDTSKIEKYILSSKYFHFSAIALAILKEREVLVSLLHAIDGKTIITFDTNVRRWLWDDTSRLRDFIIQSSSLIEILFVSSLDDEYIFGKRSPQEAIEAYAMLGYKTVIFRQGENDVLARTRSENLKVPVIKNIKVIDATAAGDAFNAGFIAAQLQGKNLDRSIMDGNLIAASVIGSQGALVDNITLSSTND
ncbi:MAG: sugar kinase [Ignavibacteriota bacterium]